MVNDLPNGYEEILSIDMKKNKKLMILVNALALIIAFIMTAAMIAKNLTVRAKDAAVYNVRIKITVISQNKKSYVVRLFCFVLNKNCLLVYN